MRKNIIQFISFFIFLFLISLSFISAFNFKVTPDTKFGFEDYTTDETNYSLVNVNNSQFFQGYTPTTLRSFFQTTYDTIYCKLTGCTMSGNINLGNNNITNSDTGFFTNLGSSVSRITKGWFSGLDVDGTVNATNLIVNNTVIINNRDAIRYPFMLS